MADTKYPNTCMESGLHWFTWNKANQDHPSWQQVQPTAAELSVCADRAEIAVQRSVMKRSLNAPRWCQFPGAPLPPPPMLARLSSPVAVLKSQPATETTSTDTMTEMVADPVPEGAPQGESPRLNKKVRASPEDTPAPDTESMPEVECMPCQPSLDEDSQVVEQELVLQPATETEDTDARPSPGFQEQEEEFSGLFQGGIFPPILASSPSSKAVKP